MYRLRTYYEELMPYVYYVGAAAAEVVEKSKAMAEVVDVPCLVHSPHGSGGSYNYAGSCGIPSILIERGCTGVWSKEEVELGKKMLEMCCVILKSWRERSLRESMSL